MRFSIYDDMELGILNFMVRDLGSGSWWKHAVELTNVHCYLQFIWVANISLIIINNTSISNIVFLLDWNILLIIRFKKSYAI